MATNPFNTLPPVTVPTPKTTIPGVQSSSPSTNNLQGQVQVANMGKIGASIGVKATAPEQNNTPVNNALPSNYVKKTVTPTNTTTSTAIQGGTTTSGNKTTTAPANYTSTLNPTQITGLQDAYTRQQKGQANATDLANLKYAQGKGWTPTTAKLVAPTPPVDNSTMINGVKEFKQTDGSYSTVDPTKTQDISHAGLIGENTGAALGQNQNAIDATTGLLNNAKVNSGNSGPAYDAYQSTLQQINELKSKIAEAGHQINSAGNSLNVESGEQANVNAQYGAQLDALSNLATAQATALGQQVAGAGVQTNQLNAAAGAGNITQGLVQSGLNNSITATAPVAPGYSNPLTNPLTGKPLNSGGGSGSSLILLPADAQAAVQNYAQQVQSGQMTRNDAEQKLSAYGVVGTNALAEVLGPNFNTNASNASAGTTATGQQLKAAIPAANQALDALQTAFNNLPGLEKTGASTVNGILQGLSMTTGIARDQTSAFQTALQEARSRIDAVLTGSIGVDAAGKQTNALLPDNMVPSELPQKITAAKQYLQNQLNSYTQSGNQNNSTSGNSQLFIDQINAATSAKELF